MQAMLEHVEGISLVGLASPVNTEALSRMPDLRILIADGVDVESPLTGFELPKLAMLSWREKAGQELSFGWSTVRKAAVIDLQGCHNLTDLPDGLQVCQPCASNLLLCNLLCLVAQLDTFIYFELGFALIVPLHKFIVSSCCFPFYLLNVKTSLHRWPKYNMCPQDLTALRELDLSNCPHLRCLPDTLGRLSSLEVLSVHGQLNRGLHTLPESMGNLSNLQLLDLTGCRKVTMLPSSFASLHKLKKLALGYCTSLLELPDALRQLSSLTVLDLSCCRSLTALPMFLGALTKLELLDLGGCKGLDITAETLRGVSGEIWEDLGEGKFKPLFEG